ncbi:hypothetical protein AN639_02475 [Candidatus Epulonipiscium fishelsonii]|uniref:Uncharacterized protein n=1 Tax=Candidatus Epulonipiscium fishelsonii TaxID=77094 RepID=A0ACC8XAZ8_9FIRM|nr:hypothetical protein AN396_07715 [Epulopiscium sp. SCG-B11WGA-EpuloA1]ONI41993.1 hypothetical protein AN639_02475 [Epulopiscium sp. SCG-B05WGA-EpuloA1]ONI47208.1 hypothetical protein AN644_01165 [Epulopiscium sp. SCG-C06WGA-EpuloA1]
MDKLKDLAILILMGGQNKRMKGQHKAFLNINNTSFLQTIISNIGQLAPIYISVNDASIVKDISYPVLEDVYNNIGPIGGIYSSLNRIPYKYVFVVGCDMPFISADIVQYLYNHIDAETDCTILSDNKGRLFPTAGIYSTSLIPKIEAQILSQNYRLYTLMENANIINIETTPLNLKNLININTPEEYQAILKIQ